MEPAVAGHLGAQDTGPSSELANTENGAHSISVPDGDAPGLDSPDASKALTRLERLAVEYYLSTASGHRTLAWALAKAHPDPLPPDWKPTPSMHTLACRMFSRVQVKAEVERRTREQFAGKDVVLQRLCSAARGLPPDCWLQIDGELRLDWERVKAHGLGHLVIGTDANGRPKLADPQRALETLARYFGMTGPDVAIAIRVDPSRLSDDELAVAIRTGQLPGT